MRAHHKGSNMTYLAIIPILLFATGLALILMSINPPDDDQDDDDPFAASIKRWGYIRD